MIFYKPKTKSNFKFYNEIGHQYLYNIAPGGIDNDDPILETKKIDKEYRSLWEEITLDSIYFYYLMIILEKYYKDEDELDISLNIFSNPEGYLEGIENIDKQIRDDGELFDFGFETNASYQYILYRIIILGGLFFCFDIKEIYLSGYIDEISKQYIKEFVKKIQNGKEIKSEDIDELYYFINELSIIDENNKYRRPITYQNKTDPDGRVFRGDGDKHTLYAYYNKDGNASNEDLWRNILNLGNYINICLEVNHKNIKLLKKLIDEIVDEALSLSIDLDVITRKFIKLAKNCEIIGSTIYVPFKMVFETDFPLLQYIYYLQKNDGCILDSWITKDVWSIKIYDETIADILGMSRNKIVKPDENKKFSFDIKNETFLYNGKKLSLGNTNDTFIREFFDLENDGSVSIDELTERMDELSINCDGNYKKKAEKRLVYDRLPLVNRKIAKETEITGFFKITNRKVRFTYPSIFER